jgi:hypothetical protein
MAFFRILTHLMPYCPNIRPDQVITMRGGGGSIVYLRVRVTLSKNLVPRKCY